MKHCARDCSDFVLLGVLQQAGGVLSGGVVLGMAQPALGVVLHPVGAVAVAQQEAVGRLSSQQQSGSCNVEELGPPAKSMAPGAASPAAHLCCLRAWHRSS